MHTWVSILGAAVIVILVLAILTIIVGVIWTVSPLRYKEYMGSVDVYRYNMPLGGRVTGLIILGFGIAGLVLGSLLDREHTKLVKKFGSRT